MDTLRRLWPMTLAVLALVTFGYSVALADGGAAAAVGSSTAGIGTVNMLSGVITLACMGTLWALRNFTVPTNWSHSPLWSLCSSVVTGIASALPPAVQHGVSREAIYTCVVGVLMAAMAQSKPVGKDTGGAGPATILLPLLFAFGLTAGCATGADGLRQACTAGDTILTGAYQTTARVYHARKEQLKAQITPATAATVKAQWDKAHDLVDKVLAALDSATDAKNAVCALIPAVEAGQRKDVNALIAQVTQIGADVAASVAEVRKLTGHYLPPSRILVWRWV